MGVFLVFAVLAAAPGDLYRCVSADGSVHFQDRPCDGEQLGRIRSNAAGSERRLREWLAELPEDTRPERVPPETAAPAPAGDRSSIALPPRPTDRDALAACSAQFLRCAGGDGAVMDRCVAGIRRCPAAGSADCCAADFIGRYQTLREHGFDRKSAVRDALLGPD